MIDAYTPARFLLDCDAQLVHEDAAGALYRALVPGDEDLVMVKVRNATAEPDGSVKDYWLRVPPTMRRAREAVAWTFGLNERAYRPRVES